MELLDALDQTFDHARKVVGGIRPDQFGNPTPCSEWDVRSLLTHTLGVIMNMECGAGGGELLPDINAVPLDNDFSAQFDAATERTLAAWRTRGLEGDVNVGAGPMPAMLGASINLVDTSAHSWDLARATDQDEALPDELATTILGVAHGFIDQVREFAGIHPAVPVGTDAPPTTQLVAFLGRRP